MASSLDGQPAPGQRPLPGRLRRGDSFPGGQGRPASFRLLQLFSWRRCSFWRWRGLVRLLTQLRRRRAVGLRRSGGQPGQQGGRQPHIGEGQHGAGCAAHCAAQLPLGVGHPEPGRLTRLGKVGGPAGAVVRRIGGHQNQPGLPRPGGSTNRLLPHLHAARLAGNAQQMQHVIHRRPPSSAPPARRRPRRAWRRRTPAPAPWTSAPA